MKFALIIFIYLLIAVPAVLIIARRLKQVSSRYKD